MTICTLDLAPIQGGELHESVIKRLDPEYLPFYQATYIGKPQVQERPPHFFKSTKGGYIPGDLQPEQVGKTEVVYVERKYTDQDLPAIPVTVWYPKSAAPPGGYPAAYMIHGGGWVLGNMISEESTQTRLCNKADIVVISPEYRLAPDAPYPAAVEDCWEVLLWLWEQGERRLGINRTRMIIGGASAGGHLSATMINLLISRPDAPKDLKFLLNVMVAPVTDNTAMEPQLGSETWDKYTSWTENAHGPTLPALKMMWYRNLFIPNPEYRLHWAASPMLAPDEFWPQHPPTWIAACEVDVLRDEGLAFGERLKAAGVPCETTVYKGMPHPAIQQAAVLKTGARMHADLVAAVRKALA